VSPAESKKPRSGSGTSKGSSAARFQDPTRRNAETVEEVRGPRERKGDARPGDGTPVAPRAGDRRAASSCLWDACEALLSTTADESALERALDALLAAFDCDGAALHARSEDGELETWCARGDWEREPGDLREAMCVPLQRGRERVGALDLLARRGQRWRPEQRSLVRTASGALGAALGARLELDRFRRQPGRDEVTGLADARAFHQRLVEEMGRAEEAGEPVAIVTLDLDHFAAVNAKFGEPAGDAVLAESAMVLKLALREGDLVARLEGDAFGVLLPDCDLAPARRLAERLRHAIEQHRFPRVGLVSVSAGVAASPRDGLDPTELLTAAERALGLAKKGGRHRTAASGPSQSH
jgi:diguanylate cyclase (GGDEF)-like protein